MKDGAMHIVKIVFSILILFCLGTSVLLSTAIREDKSPCPLCSTINKHLTWHSYVRGGYGPPLRPDEFKDKELVKKNKEYVFLDILRKSTPANFPLKYMCNSCGFTILEDHLNRLNVIKERCDLKEYPHKEEYKDILDKIKPIIYKLRTDNVKNEKWGSSLGSWEYLISVYKNFERDPVITSALYWDEEHYTYLYINIYTFLVHSYKKLGYIEKAIQFKELLDPYLDRLLVISQQKEEELPQEDKNKINTDYIHALLHKAALDYEIGEKENVLKYLHYALENLLKDPKYESYMVTQWIIFNYKMLMETEDQIPLNWYWHAGIMNFKLNFKLTFVYMLLLILIFTLWLLGIWVSKYIYMLKIKRLLLLVYYPVIYGLFFFSVRFLIFNTHNYMDLRLFTNVSIIFFVITLVFWILTLTWKKLKNSWLRKKYFGWCTIPVHFLVLVTPFLAGFSIDIVGWTDYFKIEWLDYLLQGLSIK